MWLRILIGGIVGGIVVFFVGFVTHGMLNLQSRTFANIPDSQTFIEHLRGRGLKAGFYIFPDMPKGADQNDPAKMAEATDRFKTGPAGLLLIAGTGIPSMGEMLAKEFASNVLAALLAAGVVSLAGPDIGFGRRWGAVMVMGIFAWLSISASYGIWYWFPHAFTHDEFLCTFLEWSIAGLAIAAIVRRPPIVANSPVNKG